MLTIPWWVFWAFMAVAFLAGFLWAALFRSGAKPPVIVCSECKEEGQRHAD